MNTTYILFLVIVFLSLPAHYFDFVTRKQLFFFSEPSHFAISFAPFYFYAISTSKNKTFHIIINLFLAIALSNVIFMAVVIMGFLLLLKKSNFFFLFIFIMICSGLMAILIYQPVYFDFLIARLYLSSSSENLTVLIFLSGYERAFLNLIESYGLGVGFQQMGIIGSIGQIQESIKIFSVTEHSEGKYMNLLDGGSLAPKIIAEFGIVGIIGIMAYLINFLKILKRIRLKKNSSEQQLFYYLIFIAFFVVLFMRATSYFSPTAFMFCVALIGLFNINNTATKRRRLSMNQL
jgi:hypothetical protein